MIELGKYGRRRRSGGDDSGITHINWERLYKSIRGFFVLIILGFFPYDFSSFYLPEYT